MSSSTASSGREFDLPVERPGGRYVRTPRMSNSATISPAPQALATQPTTPPALSTTTVATPPAPPIAPPAAPSIAPSIPTSSLADSASQAGVALTQAAVAVSAVATTGARQVEHQVQSWWQSWLLSIKQFYHSLFKYPLHILIGAFGATVVYYAVFKLFKQKILRWLGFGPLEVAHCTACTRLENLLEQRMDGLDALVSSSASSTNSVVTKSLVAPSSSQASGGSQVAANSIPSSATPVSATPIKSNPTWRKVYREIISEKKEQLATVSSPSEAMVTMLVDEVQTLIAENYYLSRKCAQLEAVVAKSSAVAGVSRESETNNA